MLSCAGLSVSQTGKLKETSRQWIIREQAKNSRRRDRRTCKHLFKNLNPQTPHIYIYILPEKPFLRSTLIMAARRAWWVLLAYVKICLTPSAVVNIIYYWVDVLITQACLNLIGWTVSHDQLALSLNLGIFCTDDRSLEFITIADDACTTIQCNSNVRRLVTT